MSDDTVSEGGSQAAPADWRAFPWVPIAWFGVLLILCYAPVLKRLVAQWATDGDMGHGFFVPLVAGYIAWQRRDELLAAPPVPNWWGCGGPCSSFSPLWAPSYSWREPP